MEEKILNLIQKLKHSDWKIKSQAYMTLMEIEDPKAVSLFWDKIDQTNEVIVIYFCRWLAKLICEESLPFLERLIEDSRPRVLKETMFAIEKIIRGDGISEIIKINFLIKLLEKNNDEAQIFAAKMFSKYRKKAGVPILVEVLGKSLSPRVCLSCVDAIRELQDKRALPYLERHLFDSDTNVLYAILFALGDLNYNDWNNLRPFLKDPRPTIRHVAIWAVGKLGGKFAVGDLTLVLEKEEAKQCRIEAIKRLARIHDRAILSPLLKAASLDKDQDVRNIAHFYLDHLDPDISFKECWKLRHAKDKKIRIQLFRQLAKTQKPKAFRYLSRVLLEEKDPQLQAAAIESLSFIENPKALPLLKNILGQASLHPVTAYSAMLSFSQLMGIEEIAFVVDILKNPKTSHMIQQIILKQFVMKARDKKIFFTQPLIELLIEKLKATEINVQYLAVMTLAESYDLSVIIPLFQLSLTTKDPEVSVRSLEAIEKIIEGDITLLIKLMVSSYADEKIREAILAALSSFHCKLQYKSMALLELLLLMERTTEERRIYFISSLTHIVGQDLDILLNVLRQTKWSTRVTLEVFEVIEGVIREKDPKNVILPLDAIQKGLLHPDGKIRRISIRILEKVSQARVIEDLISAVYKDPDHEVSQYARVAVRSMVNL